jgi:hypothetical protein
MVHTSRWQRTESLKRLWPPFLLFPTALLSFLSNLLSVRVDEQAEVMPPGSILVDAIEGSVVPLGDAPQRFAKVDALFYGRYDDRRDDGRWDDDRRDDDRWDDDRRDDDRRDDDRRDDDRWDDDRRRDWHEAGR